MPNRLATSLSPYLQQHAGNPIDWWPWSADAFTAARERDVPVLLSIGYAACHWCHVMAHESFEDAAVAGFVNEHFVAIKVDREEHPDVDAVHMKATQALTGSGGWPMTVFLTPEGRPFFAGTYYPPEPGHGMPSFTQLVEAIAGAWSDRRDEVVGGADAITAHLAGEFTAPEPSDRPPVAALVERAGAGFDAVNGGFGRAPKFPAPLLIDALLVTDDPAARAIAGQSLAAMARGGIHDQLGGGFHRYSVDAGWVVPHFEKMLYDNALLLGSYTRGWLAATDDDRRTLFERTVRGIVGWLGRELELPGGGFASSLDADSCDIRGMVHEGIFYAWSPELLLDALGEDDAAWAAAVFAVSADGTFEHGLSTLQLRDLDLLDQPAAERLDKVRAALLAERANRFRPARDDKLVAAWNGLAIDALVGAAMTFGEAEWLALAERAASATWTHWIDGSLRRVSRDGVVGAAPGMAEDHGALALGYARLAGALGSADWLARAVDLLEAALPLFDAGDGGFFDAPGTPQVPLFARPRDVSDNPTPSGTACLVVALRLVGLLADREDFVARADAAAATLDGMIAASPRFAGWGLADRLADEAAPTGRAVAVIVDDSGDPLGDLVRQAWRLAPAGTAIVAGPSGTAGFAHHFEARGERDGRPAAYVCRGTVCSAPATSADELRAALRGPG